MSYDVELDVYTGPLDLLLELIERQDLDICDVTLCKVTDGFLSYMEEQNLSNSEMQAFLSVATQLVKIKARTVSGSLEPSLEEEHDDSDLILQLQRHQQLKSQVQALRKLSLVNKQSFTTGSQAASSDYQHLGGRLRGSLERIFEAKLSREQFQVKLARNQPQLAKHRREFHKLLLTLQLIQLTELIDSCDSHDQQVVFFLCILESVRNQQLNISYRDQSVILEVA